VAVPADPGMRRRAARYCPMNACICAAKGQFDSKQRGVSVEAIA